MCDNKTVGIEVWPVAADTEAIWLDGRDAWRDGPLPAATTVHYEVERLLFEHGIDPDDLAVFVQMPEATPQAGVIHSTSWRDTWPAPAVVLTYMAVVRVEGYVLGTWPDAVPVTAALPAETGKPAPHRAAQVPVVRVVRRAAARAAAPEVPDLAVGGRGDRGGDGPELAAAPARPQARAGHHVRRAARRLAPGDAAAPAGVAASGVHVPFPVASFAAGGRAVAVVHLGASGLLALCAFRLAAGSPGAGTCRRGGWLPRRP